MNPTFFMARRQGDPRRRRAQRARLPHPPVRGRARRDRPRASRAPRRSSTTRSTNNDVDPVRALQGAQAMLGAVKVDRTAPKPKVGIIGEFWAMTTEGDGNYHLQRFLEEEGAECDIQLVTAWLLYMLWESPLRHQAARRTCAASTTASTGSAALGEYGVAQEAGDAVGGRHGARAASSRPSRTPVGLYGYHLPDMDEIAEIGARVLQQRPPRRRRPHGGRQADPERASRRPHDAQREAVRLHAVVGRLGRRAVAHHRALSRGDLLPDRDQRRRRGQRLSRVQMLLFKARLAAQDEYQKALDEAGLTAEQLKLKLQKSWWKRSALWYPKHGTVGGDVVERRAGRDGHGGGGALASQSQSHQRTEEGRPQGGPFLFVVRFHDASNGRGGCVGGARRVRQARGAAAEGVAVRGTSVDAGGRDADEAVRRDVGGAARRRSELTSRRISAFASSRSTRSRRRQRTGSGTPTAGPGSSSTPPRATVRRSPSGSSRRRPRASCR